MNPHAKLLVMLFGLAVIPVIQSCHPEEEREYYELKIYRFETAAQESRLDQYLETAYIPALHRAGVTRVGAFKLREEGNETKNALLVLVPYNTLGNYMEVPGKLKSDQAYLDAGRDYIESTFNDPPYIRIETMLLKAFRGSPHLRVPELDSPRPDRVYELRSYQSATELLYERKVEMFNTGESELFHKLGFNPVFFGEVISSFYMPHLMYMTAFADTTSQKECWSAFGADPDWQEMKEADRFQNTVSNITKYLLYPTPYSDY